MPRLQHERRHAPAPAGQVARAVQEQMQHAHRLTCGMLPLQRDGSSVQCRLRRGRSAQAGRKCSETPTVDGTMPIAARTFGPSRKNMFRDSAECSRTGGTGSPMRCLLLAASSAQAGRDDLRLSLRHPRDRHAVRRLHLRGHCGPGRRYVLRRSLRHLRSRGSLPGSPGGKGVSSGRCDA